MADCPYLEERDACGVGFVVDIKGSTSYDILLESKHMLVHMNHRGGCRCDDDDNDDGIPTGDGAGVLTGLPHKLYTKLLRKQLGDDQFQLIPGKYATGIFFLDTEEDKVERIKELFSEYAVQCKCNVITWRVVPGNPDCIGKTARHCQPTILQVFLASEFQEERQFQKQIYLLRKSSSKGITSLGYRFYICSLSSQTIVYKGCFTSEQLFDYYADLQDPDYETHVSVIHSRYSTNTAPTWERAHPHRMLAHNGEINTVQGNVKNITAREGNMTSDYFQHMDDTIFPIAEAGQSDSGYLDNVLEFLVTASDRTLPEAVMMLVPEAWQKDSSMEQYKKDYYKWVSCTMEPWDGPALITFCDGQYVGATLDRNGLRPSRYQVTSSGLLIMASEVGVSSVGAEDVEYKGRLMPGKMLLVDTKLGAIIEDEELKYQVATKFPVDEWMRKNMKSLEDFYKHYAQENKHAPAIISQERSSPSMGGVSVETDRRLPMFGYTVEDVNMLILPMIRDGKEALGSMGNDAPLACMTMYPQLVFDYFKQLFAQVTNPPIDPFREEIVMSTACPVGPEANLLLPNEDQCRRVYLDTPIFSPADLLVVTQTSMEGWRTKIIDIVYPLSQFTDGLVRALDDICMQAEDAIVDGYSFILLTDRKAGPEFIPVSTLLAVGAVHQHLILRKMRRKVGIIVEGGEIREIHHLCTLLGFGADVICPYMVFETFSKLRATGLLDGELSDEKIIYNYTKAAGIGLRKVLAKMGISTLHSYKGSQIFEAVGLGEEVMSKCFTGTASRISGVGFTILAQEALDRHRLAFSDRDCDNVLINSKGAYHWRDGGEKHVNDPRSLSHLQNATQNNNTKAYQKYVSSTMETILACTLRGQLQFVNAPKKIPLSEVEPASEIVKRFCTGAMSFGSISEETHKTLAIAMNKMGGRSNSGEGGEDPDRYNVHDVERNMKSSIKQVASGRFGVTSAYLASADEIQIKMAQGAKPGEGGELPGYKVTEKIAQTRFSTPGVSLISPPPHHDIYSIEDLSQLIYDLKCSNPAARLSVKLVSEVGVGVIASGVAKGLAEHIVISGHDGGTGASSWTGVKHAGLPWELGLTETHQALLKNKLRQKVMLQVDGQLRTGHDVLIAAILGSDEYAFSTAPLITLGCTMMRKCHLNTCPVGIATQDPVLRAKFNGKPEHVINYFFMVAEEVRLLLSEIGHRSIQEVIGKTHLLEPLEKKSNEKTKTLDFSVILNQAESRTHSVNKDKVKQDFKLTDRKEQELIPLIEEVVTGKKTKVTIEADIENVDRTFGTTLSHRVTTLHPDGLSDGSIHLKLKGAGGQSFGAFLCRGITLELEGDANDYIGKGLSGGRIAIYPSKEHPETYKAEKNILVGNVCLYGGTSGSAFFSGIAAERFAVRNSGVHAVVEGCGDHGCEYMTGGVVVILGETGRNFAAGMSGGIAYVYDKNETFAVKCNQERVSLVTPGPDDLIVLKQMITDHTTYTDSNVGKYVLGNWSETSSKFVKVFPNDYKRALEAKKSKANAENIPPRTENLTKISEESVKKSDSLPASPPRKRERTKSLEQSTVAAEQQKSKTDDQVVDIEEVIPNVEQEKEMIDKVLDKTRGFVKYQRNHNKYRLAKNRLKDWGEIYSRTSKRELKVQAARCMDCGVPFCQSHTGCPLGNVIPKWNDLVFNNKWKEALNRLLQTNNFPEFTGRACPAPCESACVLSINAEPVTIKSIECAIIDHAFEQGWMTPQIPKQKTGKHVAIIGSGPTGLAAAAQLNKAGHHVTVLERNDRCGGLLVYGIPSMKLDKKFVQRRIDLMAAEGIEFRTNVSVGDDESSRDLLKSFDATLLAIGSTWPRDLPVPGRNLNGIHFAMEFLETSQKHNLGRYNLPHIDAKNKNVIIIGGGDTGVDCIATSLRMDAKTITTFELLAEPPANRSAYHPWPLLPRIFRVEYGHEEVAVKYGKDPRIYNIMCKRFLGNSEGHVTGAETVDVGWVKDVSGRWMMKEVEGTKKTFQADLVLLALGFLGPERKLSNMLGVQHDMRSTIHTKPASFLTDVQNVYAAGDCRYGQSLIVTAIAEGRQAAREIDLNLMGSTSLPGPGGQVEPPRPPPKQHQL